LSKSLAVVFSVPFLEELKFILEVRDVKLR
jgi:hypothetical protein